jgi:hypothetical protein
MWPERVRASARAAGEDLSEAVMYYVVLSLLLSCASVGPVNVLPTISDARSHIGTDRGRLLARLSLPDSALQSGDYGPSVGLEVAYAPERSPARFYLQDGEVVLAYLSTPAVDGITPETLAAAHPAALELPSRAGKAFAHHVDASAGLAWSEDGTEVAFIEVFPPMELSVWKARFYEAPGTFYK